jgi:L-ascorbate metabolism protein UlaG (beta-lactamase superfamily)
VRLLARHAQAHARHRAAARGRDLGIAFLAAQATLAARQAVARALDRVLDGRVDLVLYRAVAGPTGVRYMGTTTVLLDDGENAVLVDGFFSRPGKFHTLLGTIEPDAARIDDAMRRAGIARLDAVVTAHSHFDHAMDAPEIARRTSALLIGSGSTANIGRGIDLPEARIRVVSGGESFEFGRFRMRVFASLHSPDGLFMGTIDAPLRPPVRASAYSEGGSYTYLVEHDGLRILVHPSFNFVPGMYRGVSADVVLLGAGTLGKRDEAFARAAWREVVQATGARLVVPMHWDDFMLPLDGPLVPMPRAMSDFPRGMALLARLAEADHVAVRFMPAFEPIDLEAAAAAPGPH